ncbi:MAG: alpha-D-ribose 1-methylphosphonate 5-phosphate C-P-lyase PhnJ [Thermomicrobiales bacterium]
MTVAELKASENELPTYNYAFLDELSKKAIRRAILKAVAIPGYQVPFGSRELPIARGWGTGGLQLTLSLIGPGDVVKVIDQGADDSVNAVNIRRLIERTAPDVSTTTTTVDASIIQSRHRLTEQKLRNDQIMIYQVPLPEPLRMVERRETETRRMHGEGDYSLMWVALYEDVVRNGRITRASGYPVLVNNRHIMSTSPVPRWDLPALHYAENLSLYGAGREKRIYAIPPHTSVVPLAFDDYPFEIEQFAGKHCVLCGATDTFLVPTPNDKGETYYVCSDTAWCFDRIDAAAVAAGEGAQ